MTFLSTFEMYVSLREPTQFAPTGRFYGKKVQITRGVTRKLRQVTALAETFVLMKTLPSIIAECAETQCKLANFRGAFKKSK